MVDSTETATRLLANINVVSSECWLWTDYKVAGYGRITIDGKQLLAHRVSYELFVGPIPQGLHVLHKCDVKACINPNHLYTGDDADNARDYWSRPTTVHYNTSKKVCKNGHEFTIENTHIRKNGERTCKERKRNWLRNMRASQRE